MTFVGGRSMPGRRLVFGALCGALLVAGCGSSATSGSVSGAASASKSDVLHLAYFADMSTPDPDVFYDIEGLTVTMSAYDNLIRYKPDSHDYVGDLATKWTVSPDGLTYTFTLHAGVTFSDGTPCDSAAVAASFKRRTAVNSAPAYMLQDVDHYETPDATTFIVKLKKPVLPFLDYLASSWGPKAISPTALAANAGSDTGQTYLATHSAGTGPFAITGFDRGRRYTLTRNDHYFGTRPFFREVDIDIIPDFSTQEQKLSKGDLDVVLHAFPVSELDSAKSNSSLVEHDFDSFLMPIVYLNNSKPAIKDAATRKALVDAMGLPDVVKQIYGRLGSLATGVYPTGILDSSAAPVTYTDSTSEVASTPLKGGTLDFAYVADESGVQRRAAELIAQKAQRAGVTLTIREVQPAQAYDFVKDLAHAPDLLLATNTPDAAQPDTWARILWGTGGGLNFFGYSNSGVDAALDRGLRETSSSAATADYGEAGTLMVKDSVVYPFANIKDWMVMRSDLTGVAHIPNYAWYLDLGSLGR
ncbi:MAG TPA: ABC transporter substrate-binding protein [Candidatus Dormibacteraeota bacterium]|nr:ABC transporter substrate-binding protein [Candidatus Dormibacteraeota bacterium]